MRRARESGEDGRMMCDVCGGGGGGDVRERGREGDKRGARAVSAAFFLDSVMSWLFEFQFVFTSPRRIDVHAARARANAGFLLKDLFVQRACLMLPRRFRLWSDHSVGPNGLHMPQLVLILSWTSSASRVLGTWLSRTERLTVRATAPFEGEQPWPERSVHSNARKRRSTKLLELRITGPVPRSTRVCLLFLVCFCESTTAASALHLAGSQLPQRHVWGTQPHGRARLPSTVPLTSALTVGMLRGSVLWLTWDEVLHLFAGLICNWLTGSSRLPFPSIQCAPMMHRCLERDFRAKERETWSTSRPIKPGTPATPALQ